MVALWRCLNAMALPSTGMALPRHNRGLAMAIDIMPVLHHMALHA